MKSLNRVAATVAIALCATLGAGQTSAANAAFYGAEPGPKWEYQVMDAVVARPVGIVVTGAGAVIWGVSLPFSLLGGNAGEAADKLVGGPVRETCVRCLGCSTPGRRQPQADDQ